MPDTSIIFNKTDHIAYITLNQPQITEKVARELDDACTAINQDNEVYVALITGIGDKAFCTGSVEPGGFGAVKAVLNINQPVITAINGDALGEGLELALSGDIRLASDKARFGLPQITKGLMPVAGGTQLLPRIVGKGKALELIFTGDIFTAEEAFQIGLVHKVVAAESLAAEAKALAKNLATKAPIALRYVKEVVTKGLDLTLEQGLRLEVDLYAIIHTTADRTEGVTSFLKKTPPKYIGK
jgi:enoyl-CoA hydratase